MLLSDHWIFIWQAKSYIEKGNVEAVVDPALQDDYDLQSVWKIAEIAIMCVKPHGAQRPSISEVLKEIQQAIAIQHGSELDGNCPMERDSKKPVGASMNVDHPLNLPTYQNASFPELFVQPDLR